MADTSESAAPVKHTTTRIDLGFRWIDDITIELAGGRPNSKLQLKVSADVKGQKWAIRTGQERFIHRVSNEKIPCGETKEIVVELFEYRRIYMAFEKKVPILSMKVALDDDELYTTKTYTNGNNAGLVTIRFAYSPGGELREQVEKVRRITEEQKVILDKIRHVHRFFEGLETVCSAVEDIHPYIKAASTAILSLYKLCEKQEEYRDAARSLVDEMSNLLDNGLERLSDLLRVRSNTKTAFKLITSAIEEVVDFVEEQKKGRAGNLRGALSSESKVEELRERFKKAQTSLNDSITYGLWELAMDDHLKNDLKFVSNAHYQRGAGCLLGTRVEMLADIDAWVRDPNAENMAWIHGYAGSGKSALMNSIARNLEKAYIPFTCFMCKRDDAERADVRRILSTICYDLTRYYSDYCGSVSNAVKQPEGRAITTGDVEAQMELLFGVSPSYRVVSPKHAQRPPVHVILIDALDECKNARERNTLTRHLRDLADGVPWIRIIITSRPEADIVGVFDGSSHDARIYNININDERWGTSADIRLFTEAKSKELNLDLSPDQIDCFQKKASGLFIWCTTVFRYIEESMESKARTIADVLEDHPPDSQDNPHAPLYILYQHVVNSAVSRSRDKELMEIILGVVLVASSRKPLSTNAIADTLFPNERGDKLKEKRVWVGNIIKSLFAIIYIEEGESNAVRACHLSVLDYIGGLLNGTLVSVGVPGNGTDDAFSARLEEIHARVFEGCLEVMKRELQFNICELNDSSRLNDDVPDLPARIKQNISEVLHYGCLFWISHIAQFGLMRSGGQVSAFLNSPKALFWIEALSLLDAVDRGIVALQDCASLFAAEPNVADTANEWERFLLAYGDALKSTPHLYISALSWIPGSSPLWGIVHCSFSSELPLVSGVLEAWNSERWLENVDAEVKSVVYSPDGRLFASGCRDGSIRLWEARSRKREKGPFMSGSWVCSIVFSPDNNWLASGHMDNKIRLWDLQTDSFLPRELEGHTDWIRSVAFSYDDRKFVSGSSDNSIRVWDIESGTTIGEPRRHGKEVNSVSFSADGTHIISGSDDGSVRIWNAEADGQIGELLQDHLTMVHSVACSRDGAFVASGSEDGMIRLWDAQTYKRIGILTGHTRAVNSLCFSLDSKHIVSGSEDRSVRIWAVETFSLFTKWNGHTNRVNAVSFSPDGRSVLSGSDDGTVRIWDVKETTPVDQPSAVNTTRVTSVSYVPSGNIIVSGSQDGNLVFWDAQTGIAVGKPIQCHTRAVHALAVSGDGQWLVSGSFDNNLQIWDVASRTPIGEPMLGHTEKISSVAVSPDNKLVASASFDKTVRLWDLITREAVRTLVGHEGRVTSVAFSVDGNEIISGSGDETICIWDTRTGQIVGQPLQHSHMVFAVAVSQDGQWIASGSMDSNVRTWSMSTFSEIHVLRGHSRLVRSVSFSPDSRFLISGSLDGTVRVWNVHTGQAVGNALGDALMGLTADVHSVTFAPDGNEFASVSGDGTIRFWDTRVRTDLESQRAGEIDNYELDEEELLVRWNASRACAGINSGWIKDQDNLLLWVPWQYRSYIYGGTRLVISAQRSDMIRPQVDYRKIFRHSGTRWKDIYTRQDV